MGRRNRKTQLGNNGRNARRSCGAPLSIPRLGRRKALWRFVGALALAPFGGVAFGQDPGVVSMTPGGGMAQVYAPGGYPPVVGMPPSGDYGMGGYVTPAGASGTMVAPPPAGLQGGPRFAFPTGSAFTPRLQTSSGIGDGLGWDDGYTSIGAWVPLGINSEDMLLYLDARGFASHTESGGGNFTLGYRYYLPGFDRFVGVYGAYDIDAGNTESQTFNQFAVGAESVGRFLTYRVNGYIPIGDTNKDVASGIVGDPFFRGYNIFALDREITRHQYGGFDAEVGGPLPLVGKYGMSGFLGGYYLTSDVDDTVGFQGRLEANINDDLQIGGKLTTDDVFDTNVWATITLRSPRGSWSNFFRKDWLRQPSVQTQMDRAPERSYRTFTDTKTRDTDVILTNPLDGQPYIVYHVAPNGAGGDGTFEAPSGFINNDPSYDIIYVQPGTLNSFGPIALFDNQRLLSTAVPHLFVSNELGVRQLPGFTGGSLPVLRNISSTPSAVIQLANNNEVSGFQIDGSGSLDFETGFNAIHAGIVSQAGGITSFDINRNVFTNVSSGTLLTHVGAGTGFFDGNTLNGFGFGASRGFSVTASGGSLDLSVASNSITGFIGEDANGNGALDVGEDANANFALDPGLGIEIIATNAATVNANIVGNAVTDNETGVSLNSQGGSTMTANFDSNNISNNLEDGVLAVAQDGALNATVVRNQFAGNGGPGVRFIGSGAGSLDVTVGGPSSFLGNVFDSNAGAGLVLELTQNSTGTANIFSNQFINQVDDGEPLTRFDGQGIFLSARDNADLSVVRIDRNIIEGNFGDGIGLYIQDLARMSDILIGNLDGDNNNGNVITNNRDGINLFRTGAARVDDLRIVDNAIFANNRNGIWLTAAGSQSFDIVDALIEDNLIVDNALNGIHLEVRSDAILSTEIYGNVITGNGGNGILLTEILTSPFDARFHTGFWDNNLIANNAGNGIASFAATSGLVVGQRADGTSAGNLISNNGFAGVFILGAGDALYNNNVIAANGADLGNNFDSANGPISIVGAGVDIQGVGFKGLEFVGNEIVDNFGDGVEINNNFQFFELVFTDNIVNDNLGRGYDVLNQNNAFTDLTIQGTALGESQINQNDFEGIYVVNTSSGTQNQTAAAPQPSGNFAAAGNNPSHGMNSDGSVTNTPQLVFTFLQNTVVGNGTARDIPEIFDAAGLAIRVGTSGGNYSLTGGGPNAQVGGFASDGNQIAGVPLSQSATLINGGVLASVNDNFFAGNQGSDFYTESFTSTIDPATTGGTWNGTDFNPPTTANGDPLARLDLEFLNNTFDEIDPVNLGAFYNNAEPNFKSRTNGRTLPDPNGPFTSGTRRRNAQRLAFRDNLPPFTGPNVPGDFNEYKFQGLGDSTFRVTSETVIQNPIFLQQIFLPGSIAGETSYTYSIIP